MAVINNNNNNNNINDDLGQDDVWCSGLTRSYSEHADLVLKHYQHHRRRLEPPRYTRSGPDFLHEHSLLDKEDDADDEDEQDDPKNEGQRTWRISTTTSEDGQQHQRKIYDMGRGDTGDMIGREFSELNLTTQQANYRNCDYENRMSIALQPVFSSSSQNTTTTATTTSSAEHPQLCRIFDEDNDDTEHFEFVNEYLNDQGSEYRAFKEPDSSRSAVQDSDESCAVKNCTNVITSASSTSTGAASCTRRRLNGTPMKCNLSYEDWTREKQQKLQQRKDEKRRGELARRELEEREQRRRQDKERRDYDNFLKWLERKKCEQSMKKQLLDKEIDLQKKIQDVEERAKLAKGLCLKQWYRKKEEQQKAAEQKELVRRKKDEEEKQRRLQESIKAFERWREKSKNTPRPATQGLLPHQKARPTFTNPTPWQPLIDGDASDESDEARRAKNSGTALKSQKSRKSVKR